MSDKFNDKSLEFNESITLYDVDRIDESKSYQDISINDVLVKSNTLDLLNTFVEKYNMLHNSNRNMLYNIDIKDPTSTNTMMEEFYEHMHTHRILMELDEKYTFVYEEESFEQPDIDDYNTYALVVNGSKIKYMSLSYLNLMIIGIEEKLDNWNILKL